MFLIFKSHETFTTRVFELFIRNNIIDNKYITSTFMSKQLIYSLEYVCTLFYIIEIEWNNKITITWNYFISLNNIFLKLFVML